MLIVVMVTIPKEKAKEGQRFRVNPLKWENFQEGINNN